MTDQLVKDNERIDDLQNGYYVIQRYYTKEKVTKQYVDLVNKIL